MSIEKEVVRKLVSLGIADKKTLLKEFDGDRPEVNKAIGRLIDRGDFRITLDWKLTPAPGLKVEE